MGFDLGPFSIITLNPENRLGFVLSFMDSSVGHSSVVFIITHHHAFMIEAPWWKKTINK